MEPNEAAPHICAAVRVRRHTSRGRLRRAAIGGAWVGILLATGACAPETAGGASAGVSTDDVTGEVGDGATAEPTPEPTASVAKGQSAFGQAGCSDASCAFLVLDVADFPAGTHTVSCWSDETGAPTIFHTLQHLDLPSDGSVATACYYGYPGGKVRVEVVGVSTTPWLTW